LRLLSGGSELQKVVDQTNVTIAHLKPNTNYTFYVMAYNDNGASLQSERITQKTGEDCK
jgi:predicted metal-dependent phosphotriesterase family hydrolase